MNRLLLAVHVLQRFFMIILSHHSCNPFCFLFQIFCYLFIIIMLLKTKNILFLLMMVIQMDSVYPLYEGKGELSFITSIVST